MIKSRRLYVLLISVFMLVLATACNSNGSNDSNENEPDSDGAITISFANWIEAEDATKEIFNDLITEFEKQNEGIKVESLALPFNQYKDQVIISSQGGNAPDVIQGNQSFTSAFVGSGITEPLKDLINDEILSDILEGSLAGVTFDDEVMAMPWTPHPNALFWNKEIFKEAGLDPEAPPETIDELIEYSEKISELGADSEGNPIYGIGMNTSNIPYTGNMFISILRTFGGDFVDENENLIIDEGDALVKGLEFIQDLVVSKNSPQGAEIKDLRGMFGNGSLGMLYDGDFGRETFRDISGQGEEFDEVWGVAVAPTGVTGKSETIFTEHQLMIAKDSEKKEAAAKLVEFLLSEEAMIMYHESNGVLSSMKSINELPEMNEDEYAEVFNEQMKTATPLPTANPKFDSAMEELASMVVLVSQGTDPQEAIDQILPRIEDVYK